jgi:hypothetical protein
VPSRNSVARAHVFTYNYCTGVFAFMSGAHGKAMKALRDPGEGNPS